MRRPHKKYIEHGVQIGVSRLLIRARWRLGQWDTSWDSLLNSLFTTISMSHCCPNAVPKCPTGRGPARAAKGAHGGCGRWKMGMQFNDRTSNTDRANTADQAGQKLTDLRSIRSVIIRFIRFIRVQQQTRPMHHAFFTTWDSGTWDKHINKHGPFSEKCSFA
jgi:hypothetical protein